MELLLESLSAEWSNLVQLTPKIIVAIILLFIFYLLGKLTGKAITLILMRNKFKQTHTNFFRSLSIWVFIVIGIILGLNVLGLKTLAASLVAGGGITAVALGFAFREIGENFLAGFFLAFDRPFEVGNLIQSGDLIGVVRGIELRSTHIRSADGRDIFIPSSQIFNSPLINYTKDGLRRLSFTVGIDYADDSQAARELLFEAIKNIKGVLSDPAPGVNISSLDTNFIVLEITFWLDTFQKGINLLAIKNSIMEKTRSTLASNGFTFSSNVTTNIAIDGSKPIDLE